MVTKKTYNTLDIFFLSNHFAYTYKQFHEKVFGTLQWQDINVKMNNVSNVTGMVYTTYILRLGMLNNMECNTIVTPEQIDHIS